MISPAASLGDLVLACALLGCTAAPAASPPASAAAPACTPELLSAFDPGLEVSHRQLLPPAEQQAAAQTEQVVAVACREEESDPECTGRAEAEVATAFPETTSLTSEIVARKVAWRASLRVDGGELHQTFDDLEALAAQVEQLKEAGHQVVVTALTTRAAEDSPRDALVRARGALLSRELESLRLELTVLLPDDEATALGRLQQSAARARLVVHSWEVREDRTLRLELGCVRRLAPPPADRPPR